MKAGPAALGILLSLTATGLAQTRDANSANVIPNTAALIRNVTPSVVSVVVKGQLARKRNPILNDLFYQRLFDASDLGQDDYPAGSGVIVDASQGIIVTTNHIVEHADEISVSLADGRSVKARRVAADPDTDLAVIRVSLEGLIATPLADSGKLDLGDCVIAVGNPFGFGPVVKHGVVSALRRSGSSLKGYEDFIQIDAPVDPAMAGGALISSRGELVGISTSIGGFAANHAGIGFAIPAAMIRERMDHLIKYGKVRRGRLGINVKDVTTTVTSETRHSPKQSGAIVASVETGTGAERGGLRSGDVVTAIDKQPVRNATDFRNRSASLLLYDLVELDLLRAGEPMTIRVAAITPAYRNIQGARISPVFEGAIFGPVTTDPTMKGVEVSAVQTGSRAARAGFYKGDIVTSIDQRPVLGLEELLSFAMNEEKSFVLTLIRDGRSLLILAGPLPERTHAD